MIPPRTRPSFFSSQDDEPYNDFEHSFFSSNSAQQRNINLFYTSIHHAEPFSCISPKNFLTGGEIDLRSLLGTSFCFGGCCLVELCIFAPARCTMREFMVCESCRVSSHNDPCLKRNCSFDKPLAASSGHLLHILYYDTCHSLLSCPCSAELTGDSS